jgi:hypothetical protein
VHRNQAGTGRRHERRVASWLMPKEAPQERALGPLPFLARHGTGWIGALLDGLAPCETEHLAVHFEEQR